MVDFNLRSFSREVYLILYVWTLQKCPDAAQNCHVNGSTTCGTEIITGTEIISVPTSESTHFGVSSAKNEHLSGWLQWQHIPTAHWNSSHGETSKWERRCGGICLLMFIFIFCSIFCVSYKANDDFFLGGNKEGKKRPLFIPKFTIKDISLLSQKN